MLVAALITHVTIALSSILFSTYLFFRPSKAKFYISYVLVGSTLLSGTYLVIAARSRLLPACISGCIYLGVVTVGIASARYKFAKSEARD